jgi:hypothetical protein
MSLANPVKQPLGFPISRESERVIGGENFEETDNSLTDILFSLDQKNNYLTFQR